MVTGVNARGIAMTGPLRLGESRTDTGVAEDEAEQA